MLRESQELGSSRCSIKLFFHAEPFAGSAGSNGLLAVRASQGFRDPRRPRQGTFGLPLVLEKSPARLKLDGVDAALKRFGDGCILLETWRRIGLLAEQLEHHGRHYVARFDVEDTRRFCDGK